MLNTFPLAALESTKVDGKKKKSLKLQHTAEKRTTTPEWGAKNDDDDE